jgi:5-methylcytosine-specific restriction endonuclease McrA
MTRRYTPLPVVGFALENAELYRLQKKRCFLCGFKMKRGLTREHVWPRHLGGRDVGNILLAHSHCNGIKADRPPYPCELMLRDAIYLRAEAARVALPASVAA